MRVQQHRLLFSVITCALKNAVELVAVLHLEPVKDDQLEAARQNLHAYLHYQSEYELWTIVKRQLAVPGTPCLSCRYLGRPIVLAIPES